MNKTSLASMRPHFITLVTSFWVALVVLSIAEAGRPTSTTYAQFRQGTPAPKETQNHRWEPYLSTYVSAQTAGTGFGDAVDSAIAEFNANTNIALQYAGVGWDLLIGGRNLMPSLAGCAHIFKEDENGNIVECSGATWTVQCDGRAIATKCSTVKGSGAVYGYVDLNTNPNLPYRTQSKLPEFLVLHEMGHIFGLGHTYGPGQQADESVACSPISIMNFFCDPCSSLPPNGQCFFSSYSHTNANSLQSYESGLLNNWYPPGP